MRYRSEYDVGTDSDVEFWGAVASGLSPVTAGFLGRVMDENRRVLHADPPPTQLPACDVCGGSDVSVFGLCRECTPDAYSIAAVPPAVAS